VKSCLNLSKLRPKCCRSSFSGHGVIFKKNRPIFITSRRRKWPPDNIFGVAWPWTLTSWVMTRSIVSWLRLPRRPCAKLQWYNIALFVFKLVFWSFVQCSEAWQSRTDKLRVSVDTRVKVKVKEVDLYSAFVVVPHTQGTQVRITQCYQQITSYLPLPCKHSPDGAFPDWGCGHLIAAYYSFIYPERMKDWVDLVGWFTADGLPT